MRIVVLTCALSIIMGSSGASAAPLTDLERQRLLAHLDMTERWLIDEVSRLSPAQAAFRPGPGAWSVLDVLDHLVVVGPIYWDDLQKALKAPPRDGIPRAVDAEILWYGIDRTERQRAVPGELPKGTLRDIESGLAAYRKHTAQLRQFIRTTTAEMRRHYVERERCDAYQWALLISTHVQRHILQIRDIKAGAAFPK